MVARSSAAPEPAEQVLVITRILDAPPSLVFKVWTQPEHLARWWGPEGVYRFRMRSAEGTDHWLRGVYREIVEPVRLVFTWAWEDSEGEPGHETLVTVTFAEDGGKTRLTMRQAVFESMTARDAHQGGWASCLDRLAEYVAEA